MLAVMLFLHITLAIFIIGGSLAVGALMGSQFNQPREAALPILKALSRLQMMLGPAALLVPLIGIGMVFSSDDVYKISQFWVWASLLLYVGYAALGAGPARLTGAAIIARLEAAPTGSTVAGVAPDLAQRARLIGIGFAVLNVIFIVLMVWRPGADFNINDYAG